MAVICIITQCFYVRLKVHDIEETAQDLLQSSKVQPLAPYYLFKFFWWSGVAV